MEIKMKMAKWTSKTSAKTKGEKGVRKPLRNHRERERGARQEAIGGTLLLLAHLSICRAVLIVFRNAFQVLPQRKEVR